MCDKMENYKISFGKYATKSVHLMVKDKSYCEWFLKNVKNHNELKDYIINYKKYCKQIEKNKIIKLNEIKEKMNGFNFFELPNELLRKIFFMSKQMHYNDMLIKINLKYEKQLHDRLYCSNECLSCGNRTQYNYKYCYSCNKETIKSVRDKNTKKRIKYLTNQNDTKKQRELNALPLKYFESCVIPSLKKIDTECKKTILQVMNATTNIYISSIN